MALFELAPPQARSQKRSSSGHSHSRHSAQQAPAVHSCCLPTHRGARAMPGGPTPTAHAQGTLARLCMGEGWVGAVLLLSRQPDWCSRLPIACRHRRSQESVAFAMQAHAHPRRERVLLALLRRRRGAGVHGRRGRAAHGGRSSRHRGCHAACAESDAHSGGQRVI